MIDTEVISPQAVCDRFLSGFSVVIILAGNRQYPVTNVKARTDGVYEITVRTGDGNGPKDRMTDFLTGSRTVRVLK